VFHPDVPLDSVEMPLDDFVLRVARDGRIARVEQQGRLIAILGPLVHCDGAIPSMELATSPDGLDFVSDDVRLQLRSNGNELTVSIDSEATCTGPVVRVLGGLEQGLFAGLEYLGKGERSSSKLDVETEEHVRFAPDPLLVTMPLMAFATDRATVAMTWQDMQLQPLLATPNFFDAAKDHRMALQGRKIEATVRFDQAPLEEAILWATQRHGLPAHPKTPRSPKKQFELCEAALNGPLRTEQGWGHCVEDRWQRRFYADHASTLFRLTSRVPDLPELVPGGAHVANDSIYFLTGRVDEFLRFKQARVQQFLQSQQPDGSFRYDGKYRRGHFEDTASGICARPAASLLEYAWLMGDETARSAGLKTLEYMKRFRTPRGAQVWEVPLHTPDQLASAYLVWAYVRGYELTGDEEYLAAARKWALSGIPFTYLWSRYPIMAYATPPVFGSTDWTIVCWIGRPVQWVGGVYAYALTLLAEHDDSLDWNHLARGILVSAEQMQYPTGPNTGLLPDAFDLEHQQRVPANINPCALVSLRMVLDGQLDSLAVATNENHRIVAPFPVAIHDGQAVVQSDGHTGLQYQVLIDGQRIVDVKATGKDIVELGE
jgi:hypothetical protein